MKKTTKQPTQKQLNEALLNGFRYLESKSDATQEISILTAVECMKQLRAMKSLSNWQMTHAIISTVALIALLILK